MKSTLVSNLLETLSDQSFFSEKNEEASNKSILTKPDWLFNQLAWHKLKDFAIPYCPRKTIASESYDPFKVFNGPDPLEEFIYYYVQFGPKLPMPKLIDAGERSQLGYSYKGLKNKLAV